jgi:hypothetical protein
MKGCLIEKTSEYYTAKTSVLCTKVMNSYFHMYGCG